MKVLLGPYNNDTRTVEIQIDKYDTYSVDHTLSLIIVPLLIQLRDTNHGYPSNLNEKSWIDIQNKMIWSFEQIRDESQWDIPADEWEEYNAKVQEGLDLFAKYFRSLWN
mgnify:CR=1 FL=1|tara:strand:- start:235 stop:561 length:327 start_codon:yes stop_codon:yes gene_type:complete